LQALSNPGKNDLRKLGKSQYVDQAIDCLVEEGFVSKTTKGQRIQFNIRKPYCCVDKNTQVWIDDVRPLAASGKLVPPEKPPNS
jgi:hypothetical protein